MTLVAESQSTAPSQPDGGVTLMKTLRVKLVEPKEDLTGINDVKVNSDQPDVYYNLRGVKIEKPTKPGIYIRNGKKIVIK